MAVLSGCARTSSGKLICRESWEDAAKNAVETASGTLRDLRIAEVVKMDVKIENDKVIEYRTRLQLSFKYEG